MYRLLDIDSTTLRILSRRLYMLFYYVMALNNYAMLLWNDTQYSSGGSLVITGYDLNHITFFYV
jgi:hypothetical protein